MYYGYSLMVALEYTNIRRLYIPRQEGYLKLYKWMNEPLWRQFPVHLASPVIELDDIYILRLRQRKGYPWGFAVCKILQAC